MAALTLQSEHHKTPFGDGWMVVGTYGSTGASAADDYIPKESLGLSRIISAQVTPQISGSSVQVNMVLNARGTGQTEGSSSGDLGVECASGSVRVSVMVYGTGSRGNV